jgi:putative heme iron utilization protein
MDRCRSIYFIDRPLFGKRSCSVQFVNEQGGAMFKFFVGRNENRNLKADQVGWFEALREKRRAAQPNKEQMRRYGKGPDPARR